MTGLSYDDLLFQIQCQEASLEENKAEDVNSSLPWGNLGHSGNLQHGGRQLPWLHYSGIVPTLYINC